MYKIVSKKVLIKEPFFCVNTKCLTSFLHFPQLGADLAPQIAGDTEEENRKK